MAMLPNDMTCLSLFAALGFSLGGCAEAPSAAPPTATGAPTFYQSLDSTNASVDPIAARDMISVYRRNNGLPTVAVDPALQEEARAAVDALARANDINQKKLEPLTKRLAAVHATRAMAVENVSAGYHTLAEAFSGWRD